MFFTPCGYELYVHFQFQHSAFNDIPSLSLLSVKGAVNVKKGELGVTNRNISTIEESSCHPYENIHI